MVGTGTGFDPGSVGTKWGFQGAEQDSVARFFQSTVEKYLCFLISGMEVMRSRRLLAKSFCSRSLASYEKLKPLKSRSL